VLEEAGEKKRRQLERFLAWKADAKYALREERVASQ